MAKVSNLKQLLTDEEKVKEGSFIDKIFQDLFFHSDIWTAISSLTLFFGYAVIVFMVLGHEPRFWLLIVYAGLVYALISARNKRKENVRIMIAHRIPFFAEALANSLAVGSTLEQALEQASFYLKGPIKDDFRKLIVKHKLGKDLGILLRDIDQKYPNTGLRYLISLLEEYRELGVGISPMLKRISVALTIKEEAETKIRTILAAGSSYSRLTIGIFVLIFLAMIFLLKDQLELLLSPQLKSTFFFLLSWTSAGIFLVSRLTSIDFARTFALRPFVKKFMTDRIITVDDMMNYSGKDWTFWEKNALFYSPALVGLIVGYIASWYSGNMFIIFLGFIVGAYVFWLFIKQYLVGVAEDQMIRTIEVFPEFLQVFIIGLNSGLNTFLSFQFAQNAIKDIAPRVLNRALLRAKIAMECGEEHSVTWQILAAQIPLETIVDFSELMVIAPMHGESIVNSLAQMNNGYQVKKLALVEKKATTLGQIVIPVIVMAFFPLFIFFVFGPIVLKILGLLGK